MIHKNFPYIIYTDTIIFIFLLDYVNRNHLNEIIILDCDPLDLRSFSTFNFEFGQIFKLS